MITTAPCMMVYVYCLEKVVCNSSTHLVGLQASHSLCGTGHLLLHLYEAALKLLLADRPGFELGLSLVDRILVQEALALQHSLGRPCEGLSQARGRWDTRWLVQQ